MQTHYADTILNINVVGSMVRIDFGTVTPVQVTEEGKEPRQELRATHTQQLVMPLDGFVSAFGTQEAIVNKLLEDGVLQKKASAKDTKPEGEAKKK